MISHKTYSSLTCIEKQSFFEYLKSIKNTNTPAYTNMWDDNWINNTNTLPYILEQTDRFNGINGEFYILLDEANVVACGGVYISQFNKFIGIGGVRVWTDDKYRHQSILREFLLPLHKDWCLKNKIKMTLLSFNEYNKNLIQVFKRRRLGEKKNRIDSREPHHIFYNGLNEVMFPVTIQYTKQWVIYELIDTDFEFDWKSIEWLEN